MPWTVTDPPAVAQSWTDAEKRRCVRAANAALANTDNEEQAIFACIAAAGKSDEESREFRGSLAVFKAVQRAIKLAVDEDEEDEDDEDNRSGTLTAEIMAVGTWSGSAGPMEFAESDLDEMSANFTELQQVQKVPLKLGHNEDQPLTDGQPALGWVSAVWREGQKLLARFTDVPAVVRKAIRSGRYRRISIEALNGVRYKGKTLNNVLEAVALLGADIPAVNTLADLDVLMSRPSLRSGERATFSSVVGDLPDEAGNLNEGDMMTKEEQAEFDALKQKVALFDKELQKLQTESVQLKSENERLRAEGNQRAEVEAHAKFTAKKGKLIERLDKMITDGRLTPADRERFIKDSVESDGALDRVIYTVDQLEKTIERNPEFYGNERARREAQRKQTEDGHPADQVVVQRTREYMAKHGEKNFLTAKRAVLNADLKLAESYVALQPVQGGAA